MLNFRSIRAEDKPLYDSYRHRDVTDASEGAFATVFIWDDYYHLKIADNGEFLFLRFEIDGKAPSYLFPIGSGDLNAAVNELDEYSKSRGESLIFKLVTEENAKKLEEAFRGRFNYIYDRDCADYMYSAESLKTLSGKKLHAKRNHLNYFAENYDYSFEWVDSREKLGECTEEAYRLVEGKTHNINPFELGAMKKYFENYFSFNQTGAFLRVGGRIAAMSFGEKLTANTALVQIELADEELRGAYQMINKLFCEKAFADCEFVNREEDMGIEGLRKAKEGYRPLRLVDKYTVTEKENE